MGAFNERYVADAGGRRLAVMLDIDQFEKILVELEELESIRAFDAAKHIKTKLSPLMMRSERSKMAGGELLCLHPTASSKGTGEYLRSGILANCWLDTKPRRRTEAWRVSEARRPGRLAHPRRRPQSHV